MDGYKIKTSSLLKHVKNSGGIISLIAKRMGVSREALTRWINKNPSFWEYIYEERETIIDIAETKLIKKLNEEQDWAIKFILGSTNRGRKRGYGESDMNVLQVQQNVSKEGISSEELRAVYNVIVQRKSNMEKENEC